MRPFDLLLDKLHNGKNPYTGFPTADWAGCWYGDPGAQRDIFAKAIVATNPSLIVEVGSFVGESAIHMAKLIKEQKRECAILCVDTCYASFDHWIGAPEKIQMHFGRPDLMYRFMVNVLEHECQDVIVPFAIDSQNGARVIKWLGLVPGLIYLDASHEEGDVINDMIAYWNLLPTGGGLLADDLSGHFPGVLKDAERFMQQHGIRPDLTEGEKVLFVRQ